MELRNMRQLLAIRAHGSFAKAAQALGVSQPSLSAAMARFEDRLKVKLFERTASGSVLTPIGELIAERASKVVRETEQIIRDAGLVAGGEAGAVRLGFGTALPESFTSALVERLVETYPALSISTLVLDRNQLIPLLRAAKLELAICSYGDDVVDNNLVATEVLTATAVAVAHPDHELAHESNISLERFSQFRSIGSHNETLSNDVVLRSTANDGPITQYRCNHYAPMLGLALSGRATLIAPDFVVQPYLDAGRLSRIDLDHDFRLSFVAIATRAASFSPIVSRAVQYAVELGAQLQLETTRRGP